MVPARRWLVLFYGLGWLRSSVGPEPMTRWEDRKLQMAPGQRGSGRG